MPVQLFRIQEDAERIPERCSADCSLPCHREIFHRCGGIRLEERHERVLVLEPWTKPLVVVLPVENRRHAAINIQHEIVWRCRERFSSERAFVGTFVPVPFLSAPSGPKLDPT